jgi:hypothetical protein
MWSFLSLGILIGDDSINGAGEAPNPVDDQDDSLAEVSEYLSSSAEASANGSYTNHPSAGGRKVAGSNPVRPD